MELNEVWLWYSRSQLPDTITTIEPQALSPDDVMALFWTFHPLFAGMSDVIKSVPYSTDFDEEADLALVDLAADDAFDAWPEMSAGAWRVMYERFVFCSTVVAANMVAGTRVIDQIPQGLSETAKARTLLLRYLLGHGRKIDRHILPLSRQGAAPHLPASRPIRPN